jgi:hypothetical protein
MAVFRDRPDMNEQAINARPAQARNGAQISHLFDLCQQQIDLGYDGGHLPVSASTRATARWTSRASVSSPSGQATGLLSVVVHLASLKRRTRRPAYACADRLRSR